MMACEHAEKIGNLKSVEVWLIVSFCFHEYTAGDIVAGKANEYSFSQGIWHRSDRRQILGILD
jgi:hypothetical protein